MKKIEFPKHVVDSIADFKTAYEYRGFYIYSTYSKSTYVWGIRGKDYKRPGFDYYSYTRAEMKDLIDFHLSG